MSAEPRATEEMVERLVCALVHAITGYIPSVSAVAEVLSYVDGHDGRPDLMETLGINKKLYEASRAPESEAP